MPFDLHPQERRLTAGFPLIHAYLWAMPVLLLLWEAGTQPGALGEEAATSQQWRYVTPAAGEPMEHPPFQPITLTREKPADLVEEVRYRRSKRLYAQLRYGSPDSTRVTLVVDETGPDSFDLYVDQNRNRKIEAAELVPGKGALRRLPLQAQIVNKTALDEYPRAILVRRGTTGKTLGVATAGFIEGEALLNGRRVKVRRVDGDANGLFADVRDRLWIDQTGTGQWDPFSDQFPYLPIVKLDGRRFALRADAVGKRLAFEEIVGTGRLKIHLPSLAPKARVHQLQVMLVGDDGSAFTIAGMDEIATLPVGRYALGSVSLSVLDGTSPEPWTFVFSRSGGERPERWYEVRAGQEVNVDPIGRFHFDLELREGSVRAGQDLTISPRLTTADGLLINSSARGEVEAFQSSDRYNCASVNLLSSSGALLGSHQSGFA